MLSCRTSHRCGSASSQVARCSSTCRLADCAGWRIASSRGQPFTAPAAPLLHTDCVRTRCNLAVAARHIVCSTSAAYRPRVLSATCIEYTCTELYGGTAGAFSNPLGCVCCRVQSKEPERTERLLASPLAVFPPIGSDAFESIAVTVLFKCRGDRKHLGYHLFKLTAQDMP
jgi:hypothetical protein